MGSVAEHVAVLAHALKLDIIPKAVYDNKMLALKGPENVTPVIAFAAAPKGASGGRKGQWNTVAGPYDSMAEGKAALHAQDPVLGVPVAWKFSRKGGGSENQAKFECHAHESCSFQCRVVLMTGKYYHQHLVGAEHNYLVPNERVRSNSTMSPAMFKRVKARDKYFDMYSCVFVCIL